MLKQRLAASETTEDRPKEVFLFVRPSVFSSLEKGKNGRWGSIAAQSRWREDMKCRLDNMADPALSSPPNRMRGHQRSAPTPCGSRPGWAVVVAYPRAETKATTGLTEQGFETFLPLTHTSRGLRPLFCRYAFVHLDGQTSWTPILYTRGVYDLIRSRDTGIPHIARPGVVEALRAGEAVRRTPTTNEDLYRPGAPCEAVLGGGLKVDGVVLECGKHNAIVAAIMFGQLREIVVDLCKLRLRG